MKKIESNNQPENQQAINTENIPATASDTEQNPESCINIPEAPEVSENTDEKPVEENSDSENKDAEEIKEEPIIIPVDVSGISLTTYDVSIEVGSKVMPIVTMTPQNASDKGEVWVSDNSLVATVDKYGHILGKGEGTCKVTVTSASNPEVFAVVNVSVTKRIEPEVTYINGILIANKTYPLPKDYNPGTDSTAKNALDAMIAAAAQENIRLWSRSGFRSYSTQMTLYNNYVRRDGKAAADRYSARPGYSEHQTGLAFDLNSLNLSFADTPEGIWLAAHCYEYGFIIRYPKDKEELTGYMYEPWHVRYLGNDVAKAVYESGLCLEEYLGITSCYAE